MLLSFRGRRSLLNRSPAPSAPPLPLARASRRRGADDDPASTTRDQLPAPPRHPRAPPREAFGELVRAHVTSRTWFDNTITFCILLVALATGIDVSYVHVEDRSTVPRWATLFPSLVARITLAVFTLEVCSDGSVPRTDLVS